MVVGGGRAAAAAYTSGGRAGGVCVATRSSTSLERMRACRRGNCARSRCRTSSACDAARTGLEEGPLCFRRAWCATTWCAHTRARGVHVHVRMRAACLGLRDGKGPEGNLPLLVPEAQQQLSAVHWQRGAVCEHLPTGVKGATLVRWGRRGGASGGER